MSQQTFSDIRQRFFVKDAPVRGDLVQINTLLQEISVTKDYPEVLVMLLGEMLVASSLLASTIKISGRLSIQIQASCTESPIKWAMAECSHDGQLRALASFNTDFDWATIQTPDDLLASLDNSDKNNNSQHTSVFFINIEPEQGQRYQGVVERVSHNLAECIRHYQKQSAQIPTLLKIVSTKTQASGIMVQQLPANNEQENIYLDEDLWPRIVSLTNTLTQNELLNLPASEILYRLYHEEDMQLPEQTNLQFGCTCSEEKCLTALLNMGMDEVKKLYTESQDDTINLDCHFCDTPYPISQNTALKLFS